MVNIVDAFRKLENRDPTQAELARMMEMKAEMDAIKNKVIKPKENMIEKAKTQSNITNPNQSKKRYKSRPKSSKSIN